MRRRIAIMLLLLIGGAILNVAVAWGIVLRVDSQRMESTLEFGDEIEVFSASYPSWGPRPEMRALHWFAGARYELLAGDVASESYESWLDTWAMIANVGWPVFAMQSCDIWISNQDGVVAEPTWFERGIQLDEEVDGCWGPVPGHWPFRHLPLKPIFPGFMINTAFYAALLWLIFIAPFAARRMIRRRRGLCARCAYPIGTSSVCTECGAAVEQRVET